MNITPATWIIVTGALVGGSCALLGCFLVLRRLAMLGDAISHAVLPGIVVAFILSQSRGSVSMFIGAVVLGLLTTFLVQYFSERGVEGSAAIGVTFTSLFAVGIVLVSTYGEFIDLDLDCVLYGEIAYSPFDALVVGGAYLGPRAVWTNGILFAINLIVVGLLYKQFKISSFDPTMAAAVGIHVTVMHYVLMGLVSVTTVGAFESVGAILVVAMFIVPAASAYLLTDSLGRMLAYAVGLGALSSVLGYQMAWWLDCSIAGAMVIVAGGLFALAFLFSPTHGYVTKGIAQWQLRRRLIVEDLLLWAARRVEGKPEPSFRSGELEKEPEWSFVNVASALRRLIGSGYATREGDTLTFTSTGLEKAQKLLRRHRLYERYLSDLDYPADHVHAPAHRAEHHISQDVAEALASKASDSERDPHGKPIPPEAPREPSADQEVKKE